MKRCLEKSKPECFYFVDGERKAGVHSGISGNVSGISGNVTDIIGDVSGIIGDVSGIIGNVTDIIGDVSGIIGDVDDCEITGEEREKGVVISDLIK
jgi:hypothetical protein